MNDASRSKAALAGLDWPALDWPAWADTGDTLHLLTQIVGKTRLALTPRQCHWWNVPLYVSARGLSTSAMPLGDGRLLDIEFDFVSHALVLRTSAGELRSLPLLPQSVATFYAAYRAMLAELAVAVDLDPLPVEIKEPIRFDRDERHRSYESGAAQGFWHVLRIVDTLLKRFSAGFYGKLSPVHFFWGSCDLAVTRFNGRRAPARPGVDAIQSEAYSHECISAGFWPGNGGYGRPAFYCYGAPVPDGLAERPILGPGSFNPQLGEFILDYDAARRSADPAAVVLDFLQNTYAAVADAARWDRTALERR